MKIFKSKMFICFVILIASILCVCSPSFLLSPKMETAEIVVEEQYIQVEDNVVQNNLAYQQTDTLPTSFDLRTKIKIDVEDQKTYGTCWSYGALSTVETYLAMKYNEYYDFSETHLAVKIFEENKFSGNAFSKGGNFNYFVDYVNKGYGPVLEEEMPMDVFYQKDGETTKESQAISYYKNNSSRFSKIVDVNQFVKFRDSQELTATEKLENRKAIKNHVMNYGSCTASFFSNGSTAHTQNTSFSQYAGTHYFYPYTTDVGTDHLVSIVGWDDNYKGKDKSGNTHTGAYLILNSWGEDYGQNGYYYIFYDDFAIEKWVYGVLDAELTNADNTINNTRITPSTDTGTWSYADMAERSIASIINLESKADQYITSINVPIEFKKSTAPTIKIYFFNEDEVSTIFSKSADDSTKYLNLPAGAITLASSVVDYENDLDGQGYYYNLKLQNPLQITKKYAIVFCKGNYKRYFGNQYSTASTSYYDISYYSSSGSTNLSVGAGSFDKQFIVSVTTSSSPLVQSDFLDVSTSSPLNINNTEYVIENALYDGVTMTLTNVSPNTINFSSATVTCYQPSTTTTTLTQVDKTSLFSISKTANTIKLGLNGKIGEENQGRYILKIVTGGKTYYRAFNVEKQPDPVADYTVNHFTETIDGTGTTVGNKQYAKHSSSTLTGVVGNLSQAESLALTGFVVQSFSQTSIASDGTTEINIYYNRKVVNLTVNKGEGISSVSGAGTYRYGEKVSVQAVPLVAYNFVKWSSNIFLYDNSQDNPLQVDIGINDVVLTANAEIKTFNVVTSVQGNGTVTNPGTTVVEYGAIIRYVITAYEHHLLSDIMVGLSSNTMVSVGAEVIDNAINKGYYELQGIAIHTYVCFVFAPNEYEIQVEVVGSGQVSPQTKTYTYLDDQTFTFSANSGCEVREILLDGVKVAEKINSYTIQNISADMVLKVIFAAKTDILYTVKHYMQTLDGTGVEFDGKKYKLELTENGFGEVGALTNAESDNFEGFEAGAISQQTIMADASTVVNIYYNRKSYIVTVQKGEGIASISGLGEYLFGEMVSLQAQLQASHNFAKWESANAALNEKIANPLQFNMVAENLTIKAVGKIKTFNVVASVQGNGAISNLGTTVVEYGKSIKFAITPNAHYCLSNIQQGTTQETLSAIGSALLNSAKTNGYYELTNVTSENYVHFIFEAESYEIKVEIEGSGTVNPMTKTYAYLSSQTFTFSANVGYKIGQIILDGTQVASGVSSYEIQSIDNNHTLKVVFVPSDGIAYTVKHYTETLDGSGTLYLGKYYSQNSTETLFGTTGSATNASAKNITGFKSLTFTQATIAADGSTVVIICYERIKYSVTLEKSAGVSSVSGNGTYRFGETVTIRAIMQEGFNFKCWTSSNGTINGAKSNPLQFNMMAENVTIKATSDVITFNVVASVLGNGSITNLGTNEVEYGGSIRFDIAPQEHYYLANIMQGSNKENASAINSSALSTIKLKGYYELTDVTSEKYVQFIFEAESYLITVEKEGEGEISPGTSTFKYMDVVTYTFTPNEGYKVSEVKIDGTKVAGEVSSYKLNISKALVLKVVFIPRTDIKYEVIHYIEIVDGSGIEYNGSSYTKHQKDTKYGTTGSTTQAESLTALSNYEVQPFEQVTIKADGTSVVNIFYNRKKFTITLLAEEGIAEVKGGGEYRFGETITIEAVVKDSHNFDRWKSAYAPLNDKTTISFGFVVGQQNITLTATATIKTFKVISICGSGGSITNSGTKVVDYGQTLKFEITVYLHYNLSKILVGTTSSNLSEINAEELQLAKTNGYYEMTNINSEKYVSFEFVAEKYEITVQVEGSGKVSPGTKTFVYKSSQTYTFTADEGYQVREVWLDAEKVAGNVDSYTISNISASQTLKVVFEKRGDIKYTVKHHFETLDGTGTLYESRHYVQNKTETMQGAAGESTNAVAMTVAGYEVQPFNQATILVDGSTAINIYYNRAEYIVSLVAGEGVSEVKGGGKYRFGESVAIEATVLESHRFDCWETEDANLNGSTTSTLEFEMGAKNITLTATARLRVFNVVAVVEGEGEITNAGTQQVGYGQSICYDITPNAHHHLAGIQEGNRLASMTAIDEEKLENAKSQGYYELTNITSVRYIKFVFEIDTYEVKVVVEGNGDVNPKTGNYVYLSSEIYKFTSQEGYKVGEVRVNDTKVAGTVSSYTLENISEPTTLKVVFVARDDIPYEIKHHIETLDGTGVLFGGKNYVLHKEETLFGKAGIQTQANALSLSGFDPLAFEQETISSDGSTEINIYYNRKEFSIALLMSEGVSSVLGEGTYRFGETVFVSAAVNQSHNFTCWESDNDLFNGKTNNPLEIKIDLENITLTAKAEIKKFDVTASIEGNGAITNLGTQVLNFGQGIKYLITPNQHYYLSKIEIGKSLHELMEISSQELDLAKLNNEFEILNVLENTFVKFTFLSKSYKITVEIEGMGQVSPQTDSYEYLSSQTFEFVASLGYKVGQVFVDGVSVAQGVETYTISNIEIDTTLKVIFIERDDIQYVVRHYAETLDGTGVVFGNKKYQEVSEEIKYGTTQALTDAQSKQMVGFEAQEFSQKMIEANGTTSINIYYNRKKVNITVIAGEGVAIVLGAGEYRFGEIAKVEAITERSHNFVKWESLNSEYDGITLSKIEIPIGLEAIQLKATATIKILKISIDTGKHSEVYYDYEVLEFVYGESAKFKISIEDEYLLVKVLVNGKKVDVVNNVITIDRVERDLEIEIITKHDERLFANLNVATISFCAGVSLLVIFIFIRIVIKIKRNNRRKRII